MRAFYICSIFLVLAALILSYFLVPTRQDIALMELRAKKHERAKKFYQKEYEQGSRSTDVLVALSNLSEVKGDIKTSIKHMLEYLEKNPDDIQALRRIGKLFLLNQQ